MRRKAIEKQALRRQLLHFSLRTGRLLFLALHGKVQGSKESVGQPDIPFWEVAILADMDRRGGDVTDTLMTL